VRSVTYSYRYAREILQHADFPGAWNEIAQVIDECPLFRFQNKSVKNPSLDVSQHVLNGFFARRFAADMGWTYHPKATKIQDSELAADYRKTFVGAASITVQAEIQFGNMARWYTDIFKFQAAYSQEMIQLGLLVVPTLALANRIDSNVANYERVVRELPAAALSITLPILVIGTYPDEATPVVDMHNMAFNGIAGVRKHPNPLRIVNGYLKGTPSQEINSESPTGPLPQPQQPVDDLED
jgi:Restriction endonuclease BglII